MGADDLGGEIFGHIGDAGILVLGQFATDDHGRLPLPVEYLDTADAARAPVPVVAVDVVVRLAHRLCSFAGGAGQYQPRLPFLSRYAAGEAASSRCSNSRMTRATPARMASRLAARAAR